MNDEHAPTIEERFRAMTEGQQSLVAMLFLTEAEENQAHEKGDLWERVHAKAESEGRVEQLAHEMRYTEALTRLI